MSGDVVEHASQKCEMHYSIPGHPPYFFQGSARDRSTSARTSQAPMSAERLPCPPHLHRTSSSLVVGFANASFWVR